MPVDRTRSVLPLAVVATSVALAALVSGCQPQAAQTAPPQMPPPEVNTVVLEARDVPVVYEYVGQTIGSREVEIRARVAGILLARNFEEGTVVKQGQSLYSIDPAPFQATVARAEADLVAAEARLSQAHRNVERLKAPLESKAVAQRDYDDAVSAREIAAADVKAAQARLTEAKLNLGYTRVEAPIGGVVSRSLKSEGTLVSGPDVLLTTVSRVDPMHVLFGIPDNEQTRLRTAVEQKRIVLPPDGRLEVSLKLGDGSAYPRNGRLAFSDVRVNPGTGTSEAKAELPNPQGALRPGQFVRVTLSGARRPGAVVVPQRAVLDGPQGKFVYVVDDGKAAIRPVQLGEWTGGDWVVLDGLKPGERVIVDGTFKIGPGAPVRPVDLKPQAAPATTAPVETRK
jgi:membrane fusion protein (multidrug efflux system)